MPSCRCTPTLKCCSEGIANSSLPEYERELMAKQNEPIALYWENDDWTCSFRCGVVTGHVNGWWNSTTLEGAQVEADKFWEADDTSTYSVFDTDDEHAPPPGTRCRNPYCEKLLVT